MQPQPDLFHPVPDRGHQIAGLAFGHTVHDHVVGITLEPDARVLPGHPRVERIVHEQVGQHRRDRGPLRGTPIPLLASVPSGSAIGADSHRFTYSTTHGTSAWASTALTMRA